VSEIDLIHHILYTAFMNKYYGEGKTTQEMILDLMLNYPHIFPNSAKILYAIKLLKQDGLIEEQIEYDEKDLRRCLEELEKIHPRTPKNKLKKQCLKTIRVRGVITITDLGVMRYCSKLNPEAMKIPKECHEYVSAHNQPTTTPV